MFSLATWNVNSVRMRLEHLLRWLKLRAPNVVCLQETKATDQEFPYTEINEAGYYVVHAGGKGRNGVAILSDKEPREVTIGFPDVDDQEAKERIIAATIEGVRVLSIYIPNGGSVGSDYFLYKLEFIYRLREYLDSYFDPDQDLLALCGDFNVAPEKIDVYDPELLAGHICFHERERTAIKLLKEWGLVDTYRALHPDEKGAFTWWDYQFGAFKANRGMRLDHIWVSRKLAQKLKKAIIDREPRGWKKPSDHAPVIAYFEL
ncbi:exodeoxyribonuclease III [Thermodesulfatator indicus DSM 15286]|uniref:Exodeoxyribonuclease III n=1 Tax=Thermodesulfatator indicus (strain DSM 15286 / JCM 11887 / CIR29812) TaxID=667014 RepID=F8ADW4_THEID|nr:exodeoxyribonuclease III [Thermodesulfatator indicus]AEH44929.1 exodeoxyribonuclease III [Thermodesulfatator indicus DSM 15286]